MLILHLPDYPYLLGRKILDLSLPISIPDKKIAVHLHVFYVDLLAEFLHAFE
ncbi:rhamnan synthesis F family protein, partial [Streptococcus gordonii]|uniref:rhamnan synthesis F family protein n=1 Tax=Streptococcus gordonii TaxID=1302 RepID=UPI003857AC45